MANMKARALPVPGPYVLKPCFLLDPLRFGDHYLLGRAALNVRMPGSENPGQGQVRQGLYVKSLTYVRSLTDERREARYAVGRQKPQAVSQR
jgi:hypothetical protein